MADNMTWTSEQKQVIDLRDRSLLVSAAAGSGKTADAALYKDGSTRTANYRAHL